MPSQHQHVNPALAKSVPGVGWAAHNGLALEVEAGVHQHWHTSCLTKFLYQQ